MSERDADDRAPAKAPPPGVSAATLPGARNTVARFLARGGFSGRMESLAGTGSPPSEDEIQRMAGSLVAAARDDPLAFGVLGLLRSEAAIRDELSRAVDAISATGRDARLTEPQRNALEAIVLLTGRPALFIRHDTFVLPTGQWEMLAPYQAEITAVVCSVGRIGVSMDYGTPYVGSGFVVAPGLVMTNRHVVEKFVARASGGWVLDPGCQMVIDFKQEFGVADKREYRVESVVWVDGREQVDLALVKLDAGAIAGGQMPPPLRLQSDPGYANEGNNVYVVGYPAADPKRNDPAEMQRIFAGVYEKKRLAPGRIAAIDSATGHLSHDCSTLGGNSGSCIVDLSTNSVVGLHFEGDYLVANRAVLLPALAARPEFRGLNWQAGRDA